MSSLDLEDERHFVGDDHASVLEGTLEVDVEVTTVDVRGGLEAGDRHALSHAGTRAQVLKVEGVNTGRICTRAPVENDSTLVGKLVRG